MIRVLQVFFDLFPPWLEVPRPDLECRSPATDLCLPLSCALPTLDYSLQNSHINAPVPKPAMPMETYAHVGDTQFPMSADAIPDLRLALIGNNDLKLRLVGNHAFLRWLHGELLAKLDSVMAADAPPAASFHDLHTLVTVLRILVSVAGSSPLSVMDDNHEVASLRLYVPLLSKFLDYVLNSFVPALVSPASHLPTDVVDAVLSTVCDAFHVLLVLANVLRLLLEAASFESIWRLITTIMVLADGPVAPALNPTMEKVLICGLEMIPYCLERGPRDLTVTYAEGMLSVSLTRLFNELVAIHASSLRSSSTESFGAQSVDALTSVFANGQLPQASFDLTALTALTVGVAQMLNYLKDTGRTDILPIERKFFTSTKVYHCILVLLKFEGSQLLNVAALNLIRYYLAFLDQDHLEEEESGESSVSTIFEKLFPRIVELLQYDYFTPHSQISPKFIQLPVSILSDLCLKNPEICVHLRNTNVDVRITKELEKLFGQVSVFRQLHALKLSIRNSETLADFTCLRKSFSESESEDSSALLLLQNLQLDVISSFLLLLSVFTSSNEDFRRRVTVYKSTLSSRVGPNFLCLMIFEIIDDFRFLQRQMVLSYQTFSLMQRQQKIDDKFLTWFGSNLGVLFTLLEHSIFPNTLFLIRSLSRSVSTLRTFFVDCNSIKSIFDEDAHAPELITTDPLKPVESIVDIVGADYDREISFERNGSFVTSILEVLSLLDVVHVVMMFFISSKPGCDNQKAASRKSLCVQKVILLASIANFILDFSSFRYGIINHESFLRDLAVIYMNVTKGIQSFDYSESIDESSRQIIYELLRVQLGVLQVVKNYLYNENEENRKFMWDFIPLSMIFDKSLYGTIDQPDEDTKLHNLLLLHKIIAFEIFRNLTAASAYFSEAIKESYSVYANEKHQSGLTMVPKTWNDYLFENLMSYDLFVDLNGNEEFNEKRFFTDDEFLLRLIKDKEYVRLVVGINYLEDHRYTNIPVFRKSDFPKSNLLDVWKRLLEVKLLEKLETKICGLNIGESVKLSNQLSEIKVSINWILINITWEDDAYGFQMPDKVNFRLLDTLSSNNEETRTATTSGSNLFTASNIVIEESEEEDEGEQDTEANQEPNSNDQNDVLTPLSRAKILNKHGFSNVLQRLIYEMSTPKYEPTRINRRSPLERFDNLNANDLYEKTKTAHHQIISLLSGTQHDAGKPFRVQQYSKAKTKHPLRRSSNIISSRDAVQIRTDVNEGQDPGAQTGQGSLHPGMTDRGQSDNPVLENNPEVAESGAENDDEEIDEYWIR